MRFIRLKSDNWNNVIVTETLYSQIRLEMSTGDYCTHEHHEIDLECIGLYEKVYDCNDSCFWPKLTKSNLVQLADFKTKSTKPQVNTELSDKYFKDAMERYKMTKERERLERIKNNASAKHEKTRA